MRWLDGTCFKRRMGWLAYLLAVSSLNCGRDFPVAAIFLLNQV